MTRQSHPALWAVLAMCVASSTACPQEQTCGEPAYGGDASDEAYRTMVDARDDATTGGAAPVVTAPEDGATLAVDDEPPLISWTSTLSAALGPAPRPPAALTRRAPSLLDRASALLIPPAHAHLPPVTGGIYLVEIDVPERECPVAGLTTDLEWQLSTESFAPLKDAAGKELTLRIMSAYFSENRVSEGPYEPDQATTFTVE